jgi:photosystem II stability/assembly factor-like uncharacterized protein
MRPARLLRVSLIVLALPFTLGAQRRVPESALATGTYNPKLYSDASLTSRNFKALRWRNIGPFRGGRADAVAGDPTRPLVYYFGAVNGGVWKTTNAGATWENITDGKTDISSVGAISVAPSDPNVIYVGGGESELREDLTYGNGVYRSTDGGATWRHLGLSNSHTITAIRIDPRDPDRAYVAAMGHAFGPNAERGVYRTIDGGKSWKRILFLNDSTGATDVSLDPTNPRVLFAAMWKFQRFPWGMESGSGRSGLWKSTDGGDSWTEITHNEGMPKTLIGKIGVAVSPANPKRIYASIEAKDTSGGIFRSDDGGDTWDRVNGDQKFQIRPFYYSKVTADPTNENTLYVMNLTVWKSIDAGKTFSRIRVPHGDTHIMWVDPKDPNRLINGNDGGATVSQDGGRTWSSIMNQPTAQFYHVITDNQWPYRVYGAQQDNTTVSIASRSDRGVIGERDWWPVAGCENAHIAVDPRNPDVTYGGCYTGILGRYDKRTGQNRDISVWLSNYDGIAAKDVPNRFQWTFPVLLSPHDPRTLYVASQNVWRSSDEGSSWEKISPDLSYADTTTLGRSGGDVHGDMTGTEWYATVYALAESPTTKGQLWAGTDDGRVHLTRDGGSSWTEVTPKAMVKNTRVNGIEPSRYDPAVAYMSATRYQLDDFRPYLYKTTDFGKTWTRIDAGIPVGAYTRSIREDNTRRGLLFAATEIGVYVSMNDGVSWEPLQLNLPRVSVRDLAVKDNDLIAATHGRAFWILDDLTPLRQLADSVTRKSAHLFAPAKAIRFAGGHSLTTQAGENPPDGAVVDFYLNDSTAQKVTLQFVDRTGAVIRSFNSAGKGADSTKKDSTTKDTTKTETVTKTLGARATVQHDTGTVIAEKPPRDTLAFVPADSIVPVRAGTSRFVWDLRYPDATGLKTVVNDEGTIAGPKAVPGDYVVRLIVGRDTMSRPLTIVEDPRIQVATADLQKSFDLAIRVRDKITEISDAFNRIEDLQEQIDKRVDQTKDQSYAASLKSATKPVRDKLEVVRTELVDWYNHADQSTLHFPIRLYNMMLTLADQVQSADAAPTKQHGEIFTDLGRKVDVQVRALQQIEASEVANLNKLLIQLGVPPVYVKPVKPKGIA